MSGRRFPHLIVTSFKSIDDWSGMLPVSADLQQLCDDDLVPGTKPSALLKEALADFIREATAIAGSALGFDDVMREGPFTAVLPRLPGSDHHFVMGWKGSGGTTFIASTIPLPHLHQEDSDYAGFDGLGRITYFGRKLER